MTLRETALSAIEETRWVPEKSKNRIRAMVEGRPDWVISRQRAWGVPIALYVHRKSGDYLRDDAVNARIVAAFEQGGADAWFTADHQQLLGSGYQLADYEIVTDILDVWFDSGSTHAFVIEQRYGEGVRADLYVEGSDQHRGWFQSSLLESAGTRGRAPYHAVLTHGFALDQNNRKMSKSDGNVVDPLKIIDEAGADILRLWVASTDYSGDLNIDDKILARVVDAYRRIRNTLRFLLANTSDFDAETDTVPEAELLEVDRWAIARAAELQAEILGTFDAAAGVFRGGHYGAYEFHPVVAKLQVYCSEDLGAFYLDVLKDRLYTTAPKSHARRSAQTALHRITHAMLRWMAPFLSFTAEEAWPILAGGPGKRPVTSSIFSETYARFDAPDAPLLARWARLREIRDAVNKEIEAVRATGAVGSSLQAAVRIAAPAEDRALLESLGEDLRFVLITSSAEVVAGDSLAVSVAPRAAPKCERCWHYREDVGCEPRHPTLCGRCVANLFGDGEARRIA